MHAVVTLSASYGAGGSVVGPRVAERLHAQFLDRAIPARVAEQLAVPLEEAVARDERASGRVGRMLQRLAPLGTAFGGGADASVLPPPLEDEDYGHAVARVIQEQAANGPVVVLGRAGAFVLKDHPGAFHVRLDGPRAARIAQAAQVEDVTPDTAERRLDETDRARVAYVKALHGCDPREARHYHLVIDSTALPLDAVADLVVRAQQARTA